jgi:hypothetical protein
MKLIKRMEYSETSIQMFLLRILIPFAGLLDELICILSFTILVGSFKYYVIRKRAMLKCKNQVGGR